MVWMIDQPSMRFVKKSLASCEQRAVVGYEGVFVMNKEDKPIRVNICWELKKERKCETLSKDKAYALRKYVEDNDGVVFWFSALDN